MKSKRIKDYDRKLLKLKKKCGWWSRGYVNLNRFQKGLDKLNGDKE